MSDLVSRLREAHRSHCTIQMLDAETPTALSEAADRIEQLEAALRELLDSCSRFPVAGGDGGTFVVTPPSAEAMNKAQSLLSQSAQVDGGYPDGFWT